MDSNDLWNADRARRYDTPGEGAFADAVLTPAVECLARLAAGGAVLEFAIGTGRLALPLAARGVAVSGIELSPDMIAVLRSKPGGTAIPVVQGDMATASAGAGFALVCLAYNTIGNLLTQPEQVACFRNAARHLRSGGRFVVENMVPDLRRLPPGQEAVVFAATDGYVGLDTYDPVAQRLTSHHFTMAADGTARHEIMPQRYAWPAELDLMAELAGMRLESRWADWSGAPFAAESRSHVSVWRLA
jgi:SAM-dependent methyltransferase